MATTPYIVTADLILWATDQDLIDLSNIDGEITESVNEAVVALAILGAQGEVNGYLSKQYVVPLTLPVPDIVADLVAFLAIYRLRCARGMMCDGWEPKYAQVMEYLNDLAEGTTDIPELAGGVDPTPLTITSNTRTMSRTLFARW
jgi:phage gp36-like protein